MIDSITSPKSKHLVLLGDYYSSVYAVNTLFDTILDCDEIVEETTQLFNPVNESDFQMTFITKSNPAQSPLILSDGIVPNLINLNFVIGLDKSEDLVYFVETPTDPDYFSLMEGWNKTLSINLTYSSSGTTSLSHIIEDYQNNTAPTWVMLDEVNNQLNVSIPQVSSDTDFYFKIVTNTVGTSTNYTMVVNLTVLN